MEMEEAMSSKTVVSYCNTTQHHKSEDLDLTLYHCENIMSLIINTNMVDVLISEVNVALVPLSAGS
jgi:hypothetical protein